MRKFVICDCGKWGEVPKEFRETQHFLVCESCVNFAYLQGGNPEEAGYREKDKGTFRVKKQQI